MKDLNEAHGPKIIDAMGALADEFAKGYGLAPADVELVVFCVVGGEAQPYASVSDDVVTKIVRGYLAAVDAGMMDSHNLPGAQNANH